MIARHCLLVVVLSVLVMTFGCGPAGETAELFRASEAGDQAGVERLLKKHPQLVNATDNKGRTALHVAVAARQGDVIKALLTHNADIRIEDNRGLTPMRLAAESGSEELATQFLMNIPDIDLRESARAGDADAVFLVAVGDPDRVNFKPPQDYRESPLTLAIESRHVEVRRILLSAGADLKSVSTWTPLHRAAWKSQSDLVEEYLAAGVDVKTLHNYYGTPLHQAACKDNVDIIDMLLRAGANVNLATEKNWTVLDAAASRGHFAVVRRLVSAGAKIDVAAKWGWRPVHSALWAGHDEIASFLLARGAKMDVFIAAGLGRTNLTQTLMAQPMPKGFAESTGSRPIFWAARCGRLGTLKALLKNDADLKARNRHQGKTLLHLAAEGDHIEVIQWLIGRGAKVDAATADLSWFHRVTPFHVAVKAGRINAAKALLAAGADIERVTERSSATKGLTKSGYSPLLVAITNGRKEMVVFLLDRGADIEAGATERVTPLSEAAGEGKMEICKLLLARGAKVNGKSPTATPLHRAACYDRLEIMKLLLSKGADINAGASGGRTPLHSAVGNVKTRAAKFLLARGAKVSFSAEGGCESLLRKALERQDAELVRLLLAGGATVTLKDNDAICIYAGRFGDVEIMKKLLAGRLQLKSAKSSRWATNDLTTAMQGAISMGRKDMVRFLLEKGADPNEKNRSDLKPLHQAAKYGVKLVVIVLLDAGVDVNQSFRHNSTPLSLAAEGGHAGVVRLLLQRGANGKEAAFRSAAGAGKIRTVDALLRAGVATDSPVAAEAIRNAVQNRKTDMIRTLLARGVSANAIDKRGYTPLHTAVEHYSPEKEIVELLLVGGADPSIKNKAKLTPLHLAIIRNRYNLAGILLAKDAEVDVFAAAAMGLKQRVADLILKDACLIHKGRGGIGAPLHWAAHGGHMDIVGFLLTHNADVNGRSKSGNQVAMTPLYWAAQNGHVEVVRLLLNRGADVNGTGSGPNRRWNALHAAVMHARTDVVSLLLKHKADPKVGSGWTPLHTAANLGLPKITELLVRHGADIRALAEYKMTALDVATSDVNYGNYLPRDNKAHMPKPDRPGVVKVLLDYYIEDSSEVAKKSVGVALIWAAGKGNVAMVKRLLATGADVNARAKRKYDRTPLMEAAFQRHNRGSRNSLAEEKKKQDYLEIIRLLLEKGADVSLTNRQKRNAMWFARRYRDKEVIELLRR